MRDVGASPPVPSDGGVSGDGSPATGRPQDGELGLDLILEEVDTVVDPIAESTAFGPAMGFAAAGGPMVALPPDQAAPGFVAADDTVRAGLLQAGPVAVAGLVVNASAALLVVAVARLVSSRSYGEIAQLLGLFFILSMPGSAVLVGVVRRVTGLQVAGQSHLVRRWVSRLHRLCLFAIGIELVLVLALQGWIARWLGLPDGKGVVLILMAAGVWILLSVDRGLLQAHRSYRPLAANLLVEGGIRTGLVLALVTGGLGVAGYALGVFASEAAATAHAHWLARRAWVDPTGCPAVADAGEGTGAPVTARPPSCSPGASSSPTCRRPSWGWRCSASSRTST